jgi:hypothetical protein
MNKQLNQPEKVKCIYCNEPIKVKEWAGVCKRGYICKNISCMLKLRKELENKNV